MKKLPRIILIFSLLFLLSGASLANALTITLSPDNVGITSFSYSVSGTHIDIYETWETVGFGFLKFDDLDAGTNYTVPSISPTIRESIGTGSPTNFLILPETKKTPIMMKQYRAGCLLIFQDQTIMMA